MHTWQELIHTKQIDLNLGVLGFMSFSDQPSNSGPEVKEIPYFTLRGVYIDNDVDKAKRAMKPFLDIAGNYPPPDIKWPPMFSEASKLPYDYASEHDIDDIDGIIPSSIKEIKRCAYVQRTLSIKEYQKIVDFFLKAPSHYNILSLEAYGGQNSMLDSKDRAFCHRNVFFDIFVDSFWDLDSEKVKAHNWLQDFFLSEEMKEIWVDSKGRFEYYQNYPYDEYSNWEYGYFKDNYPKLQQIKAIWDPHCVFSFPQGIKPAGSDSKL